MKYKLCYLTKIKTKRIAISLLGLDLRTVSGECQLNRKVLGSLWALFSHRASKLMLPT